MFIVTSCTLLIESSCKVAQSRTSMVRVNTLSPISELNHFCRYQRALVVRRYVSPDSLAFPAIDSSGFSRGYDPGFAVCDGTRLTVFGVCHDDTGVARC